MQVNKSLPKQAPKRQNCCWNSEKEDDLLSRLLELPIWHSYSSTKNTSASKSMLGGPREEEQVFLDDLARLQRQEKEANEEAEALRKNLEQETKNLVTQAGAAKSSSTNIFSTVSTTAKASGTNLVNTVSIQEDIRSLEMKGLGLMLMPPEELLQFEIQKVWILVDCLYGKRLIGTSGYSTEIRRYEKGVVFVSLSDDVKSSFLYGKIDEEKAFWSKMSEASDVDGPSSIGEKLGSDGDFFLSRSSSDKVDADDELTKIVYYKMDERIKM
ncbi:hypothetical protein Tco_1571365 [Tanacetum coccineum]